MLHHFRTDVLTKEEAIDVLKRKEAGKEEREKILLRTGYPAYTTVRIILPFLV